MVRVQPILLVEDNESDEELTLRALRKVGLLNPIEVVRDGQEAVDYLLGDDAEAKRPLPMVVLLDIRMPKLNGIEVLQRLRANARTRTLPVVLFTSSDEECDRSLGYLHGANSYVRKPVEYQAFLKAAGDLGTYWSKLNLPPSDPGA